MITNIETNEEDLTLNQPDVPLVNYRAVDDADTLRENVYQKALVAARGVQPLQYGKFQLELTDVDYEDLPKPTKRDQTKALLNRQSITRRLKGTWSLKDNQIGEVVDQRKQIIANVPHVLHDGSIVMRGTRYASGLQQRLRPGVYTRVRKSGELEAHVNAKVGTGPSHRYVLEPETGRFLLNIGNSKIPLSNLLDVLGVDRNRVEELWGKELTAVNYGKQDPKALNKLYDKFVPNRNRIKEDLSNPAAMKQKIADVFSNIGLDQGVVTQTLNLPTEHLNPEVILAATSKILDISKQQQERDDRDHPGFATFHDLSDLISERISNDHGGVRRQLMYKIAQKGNLGNLPSGYLDKQINSVIFGSGLAAAVEETNPADILDRITKVTRYGEGGLPSTQSTPSEARNVNLGQFGFIDPVRTAESLRVGVDVNVANPTFIGSDNKLYANFINLRTGDTEMHSPDELFNSSLVIGSSPIEGWDSAVVNGKLQLVREGEGDYKLPSYDNAFNALSQILPIKSASFAQRLSMGARMSQQALPLEGAEAPLVQSAVPGTSGIDTYESRIGTKLGAIRAKDRGRVLSVTEDFIEIAYPNGEVVKEDIDYYRPTARKTFIHNTPLVQPGDIVEPGQLLAKSNFTDDTGTLAFGKNVRTALMPWGENWEDAIVFSQSMANKMKLTQAYKSHFEITDKDQVGKRPFVSVFASKYDKDILDTLDDNGVVKPGTVVKKGDPLILAIRETDMTGNRVHKKKAKSYSDASITWDHNHDGLVTHVADSGKGFSVMATTSKPLEEADKVAGLYGNKGTVRILPDAQMPVAEDGEIIDALISPLAVISRGNSSFPLTMILGKVAAKTGKPYKIEDFTGQDFTQLVKEELAKNNMSATETVTDPNTGRQIPGVLVGNSYLMALHHSAEAKSSARSIGSYSASGEPARGVRGQAKRVSGQELAAHMAQGAYKYSRESSLLRGRRNDDFWSAYMDGHSIELPQVNEVYEGFLDRLRGAGINPVKTGSDVQLMAMTDNNVRELAGNKRVTVPDTVNIFKDLQPIKGGLMDPAIFGEGDKFAAFDLPEALPNPVFEEPLRKLLGVTENKFRGIIAGTEELGKFGKGPNALHSYLKSLNVEDEIKKARQEIAGTKKTARDAAVKRLRYLKMFERTGVKPEELMVSVVPVIPPNLRPISRIGDKGSVAVSDANYLYRELMLASENLGEMKQFSSDLASERLATYDAHKALVGLTDPQSRELRSKKVKGLIKEIIGDSPKTGIVQRRLLSTNVDNVTRGVLVPDTSLKMGQVGVPVAQALTSYSNYVIRDLVQSGMPRVEALESVKNKSKEAIQALQRVVKDRPVVLSRAPVLHRYGNIALEPVLVSGDGIRLNPFVYKGLGADNDGDAVNMHVPHSDEVVREVRQRLSPVSMLIHHQDKKTPAFSVSQDHLLGLYYASTKRNDRKRTKYFASTQDALAAFRRGELNFDEPVRVSDS